MTTKLCHKYSLYPGFLPNKYCWPDAQFSIWFSSTLLYVKDLVKAVVLTMVWADDKSVLLVNISTMSSNRPCSLLTLFFSLARKVWGCLNQNFSHSYSLKKKKKKIRKERKKGIPWYHLAKIAEMGELKWALKIRDLKFSHGEYLTSLALYRFASRLKRLFRDMQIYYLTIYFYFYCFLCSWAVM